MKVKELQSYIDQFNVGKSQNERLRRSGNKKDLMKRVAEIFSINISVPVNPACALLMDILERKKGKLMATLSGHMSWELNMRRKDQLFFLVMSMQALITFRNLAWMIYQKMKVLTQVLMMKKNHVQELK